MKCSALLFLGLLACSPETNVNGKDDTDDSGLNQDADSDGFLVSEDCDDTDAAINPSAVEICDGLDNDCDSEVDEGVTTTYYADVDGDGYGDETKPEVACEKSQGFAPAAGDCDDTNPDIYPGSPEICDGLDNDCDSEVDEGVTTTYYADVDGDGYGNDADSFVQCGQPAGYVATPGDCDDADPTINPGVADTFNDGQDQDCDGADANTVTIQFTINYAGWVSVWQGDETYSCDGVATCEVTFEASEFERQPIAFNFDADADGYVDPNNMIFINSADYAEQLAAGTMSPDSVLVLENTEYDALPDADKANYHYVEFGGTWFTAGGFDEKSGGFITGMAAMDWSVMSDPWATVLYWYPTGSANLNGIVVTNTTGLTTIAAYYVSPREAPLL